MINKPIRWEQHFPQTEEWEPEIRMTTVRNECWDKWEAYHNDYVKMLQDSMKKAINDTIEVEYGEKVIPMFDSLFTDGDYRKSFYDAVEERIKEL